MWENVLKRGKSYPIAGSPKRKATWTGEHRCPRKGEWYLSGAIIEAYKAPNDLTTAYPIAVLKK